MAVAPIAPAEYRERTDRLADHLRARGLSAAVLFDAARLYYYCGFAYIPTERPVALVVERSGRRLLFVPRLEWEHAEAEADVEGMESYPEYPGKPHPMQALAGLLAGHAGRLGADADGYPWILGYQGPALSDLLGSRPVGVGVFIEGQMMVKSVGELALIRESAHWGDLAHQRLAAHARPGVRELEAGGKASLEAGLLLQAAWGERYRSHSPYYSGPSATTRGQVGRGAAIPAALTGAPTYQLGDVLITEARCPFWGYDSELERTLFLGPAGEEANRLFDAMCALDELAWGLLRPGQPCAEVDRAVRAGYEAGGLLPFWKHHTGHGIGLRYHEGPYLDIHDPTILAPGMVVTVEPGLYAPDLGGFRHSDTFIITEEGAERITTFPRDRKSLTLPA